MPSHKHSGTKLLRRPLSPPTPPAPKPSAPIPDPLKKTVHGHHQSRSLHSLCSLNQDAEEEDDVEEELVFRGHNLSPVPSIIPSLASDFQEAQLAPQNTPKIPLKPSPQVCRSHSGPVNSPRTVPINKNDLRFVLESRYKPRGCSAETFRPGSLVKPYKPRGPDGFPFRIPHHLPEVRKELLYLDQEHLRYQLPPDFTLEDFQVEFAPYGRPLHRERLKKAILSKQNYKKLTTLFATFAETPVQEKVHTVELKGEDIPEVVPRVPQHQLLIEMASIIRQQMRNMINEEMIGSMSGPQTDQSTTLTPALAALAYHQAESASSTLVALSGQAETGKDVMFNMPVSKYFQGSRRSNSPFNEQDSSITPSELAILDCLVNGGLALSLKAHFILAMPEISPLTKTLTYLNLSFNDFRVFPPELLTLRSLEVLKLRNNPLKELPYDIHRLSKLRTLVVSFNLITSLPPSLFTLPLQFLDLSYNKLSFLPSEIRHLRSSLRELNVEGNQLPALPCSALKLRKLRYLRVMNNFMHPLFWKENSQNDPQRLVDLSSLVVKQSGLRPSMLPDSLRVVLNRYSTCDCCQGPLYGPGLRVIRPCSKAFGVRKLPFIFTSCSPYCRDTFRTSVESLTQMLYMGDD